MFRWITSGESHGKALTVILEGLPAGLEITPTVINKELTRRQLGYGRGKRMEIEKDQIEILSGVRLGKTLGTPLTLLIENKDWENWQKIMNPLKAATPLPALTAPRPGHADLPGAIKFQEKDLRNILERASARETAARVAAGAIAKTLLKEFNILFLSHVLSIGKAGANFKKPPAFKDLKKIDASPMRCFDEKASTKMVREIDKAKLKKDTLGGIFEVLVYGLPPGLGSYSSWDKKLDGRIAQAVMSIPAIKGVVVGEGFLLAEKRGSEAHDEIFYEEKKGFYRKTNRAGGLEAGVTNGETLIVQAAMKPLPTLGRPLKTVDLVTKKRTQAFRERADICAVPAAAVIGEAVVALEIARAFLQKFGGDSLKELKANYQNYFKRIKDF